MTKADIIKKFNTKVGYPALITEYSGWFFGYVSIPPNHPWYGKHYFDEVNVFPSTETKAINLPIMNLIDIQSEITHSGRCPGMENSWCFGLECHPYEQILRPSSPDQATDYAVAEVEKLAGQLKKYENKEKNHD